jgi:flavodoxin
MKTLIVFYSLTGNVKKIAAAIATATGGDLLEIKTKKEIPTSGFGKYFWGGKQVMRKEMPELLPFGKNPNDYDLIFIGTPVWAGNFAPAIRSFLASAKLQNKKIALFCSHGGDSAGSTFVNLAKELADNEIIDKINFQMGKVTPAQLQDIQQKTVSWAKNIAVKKN